MVLEVSESVMGREWKRGFQRTVIGGNENKTVDGEGELCEETVGGKTTWKGI